MSRAAGLCPQCGGPKRGRAARASSPVATCSRCPDAVCEKHVDMIGGEWVCSKCQRAAKKAASPRPAGGDSSVDPDAAWAGSLYKS